MPYVLRVVFHRGDNFPHASEDFGFFFFVHVALKQLQHIEPIAGIADKGREEHVQPVVYGDEVVPVAGSPTQGGFEFTESLPPKVPGLEGL